VGTARGVCGFLASAWHGVEDVGAETVDGLASMGNAMITHPGADAGELAGLLLTGVSATGDAGGALLDATGVGAIVGVPLNVVSTAGVVAGSGLMMASAADLASNAFGDDRVEPLRAGGGDSGPTQDPRLVPGTQEYDDYIDELSQDPAHGGESRPASEREAAVAVQAEADGDKGQKVLLDPDGMTPARLANLQELVANNPDWQGEVVWGK
jgi:hypothetical protein